MLALDDLDLAYLAMEEPEFAENPFPHFEAARKKHPWLAKCAFGYVVHGYEAIKELLWMDDKMRPDHDGVVDIMGAQNTPWGRFEVESILGVSNADHKRIRDVVAPMFTPLQANRNRPLMRETMMRVLEEWVPKGAFDFEEFASYFPITVMSALIGASPDEIPRLRKSMEALGLSFSLDRNHLPALQKAVGIMDEFVQRLVAERRAGARAGKGADLLDTLLAANAKGGLSDRELYDLLIFLFVAGYDTSKNVLTLIMYVLLDRPEDYERCAEDAGFCTRVVEETLRFNSPASIPRLLTHDIVYRDVLLPKGAMIFFTTGMAGRDPEAFENPDAFNPDREQKNRHMAFGRGAHLCLGQFIARAQIEEGLHLIAQHIKNPKLAGPVGHRPFFGVWGLKGLPIEFEPAPVA